MKDLQSSFEETEAYDDSRAVKRLIDDMIASINYHSINNTEL